MKTKTVFSIGTDIKILEGGRVYERVREYANLIYGEYYCFVFTNDDKKNKYVVRTKNFTLVAVYGENKYEQIKKLYFHIRQLVNKNNMEIIWYPQDSFEIGLLSWLLKSFFGSREDKLYLQCHTDISHVNFRNLSWRNYLQYLIARVVFRRADKIRVVSNRMKSYLVEELKINEHKILSLPIYFDLKKSDGFERTGSLPEWEGRGGDFLIMSRIEKEKNIEIAILALQEINKEIKLKSEKEFTLKIVGDGNLKKSLQDKFGDMEWIVWEKWTNNPTQEYQNSRYFLLPSLYEGWGLTAIESVSNGTPVIMTNVGCAHEVIKDFENGVVAGGFGVREFKEAILKAVNAEFKKENLLKSVIGLDSKEEYLNKLKKFLNE